VPVGEKETRVKTLWQGELLIYHRDPYVMTFYISGQGLFEWFVIRKQDGMWELEKSRLPTKMTSEGDPLAGVPFSPYRVGKVRKRPQFFEVTLYDHRHFTWCHTLDAVKAYLPKLVIPKGVEVNLCRFTVPGTIPHVRVASVIFDRERWTPSKARAWIDKNKLAEFVKPMIEGVI